MKYGFIGCGNMGGAVARAVCKGAGAGDVLLANRTPAKAQALAEELGCACGTNEEVASICDFIFLGVKPQMMADMLDELAPALEARAESRPFVLVTMAAGLSMQQIRMMAGSGYPIIRMMPNTPVALGDGMIQYCSDDVEPDKLNEWLTAMAPAGRLDAVPESLIDAASAVSGCGPAWAYQFIEALADGGVAAGLPRAKAHALAGELGCACGTNEQVASICDFIFLGVKPQMMADMLDELAPTLEARAESRPFVLVSMAAGLSMQQIRHMAGSGYPIIRMMPNTPVALGAGMIQYCCDDVEPAQLQEWLAAMQPAGRLDEVPETLIDAASAVSGCGPAWVYQFIEALADGGVAAGLPRAKAQEYAAQMVLGSAKLVLESGKHPGELKDAVCSPGGSTIQGVRVLEEQGFRGAVMDAVLAAYDRTKEMGKG